MCAFRLSEERSEERYGKPELTANENRNINQEPIALLNTSVGCILAFGAGDLPRGTRYRLQADNLLGEAERYAEYPVPPDMPPEK